MTHEAPPTALERLVREGSEEDLRRFLLLLQPPEIADIIEALDKPEDRTRAFRAIVGPKRPNVMRELRGEEREDLLEDLAPEETARLVSAMKSDDAADVLQDLDEEDQERVLEHVPPQDRAEIEEVLEYPEDTAGGIMQTERVDVREDQTVRDARQEIRRTRHDIGELHEIFVVDAEGRLKGWVKERAFILASDDDRIATITTPVPKRVPVTMDQEEIADLVRDYDLSSVPVVDDGDRLVGRILVDDIVDVVTEEATEDITRLGGTDPEEIYEPSIAQALKSRLPWLAVGLVGSLIASLVIASGEVAVKQAGVLFAFFPVIMGVAGASSNQAATVTVRSLALKRLRGGQIGSVLRKELATAALTAVSVALILGVVVAVVGGDPNVAKMAAFAVAGTITLGVTFGATFPLLLDRLGIDPAVATTPFVSTANDLLGATIIILVVHFLL